MLDLLFFLSFSSKLLKQSLFLWNPVWNLSFLMNELSLDFRVVVVLNRAHFGERNSAGIRVFNVFILLSLTVHCLEIDELLCIRGANKSRLLWKCVLSSMICILSFASLMLLISGPLFFLWRFVFEHIYVDFTALAYFHIRLCNCLIKLHSVSRASLLGLNPLLWLCSCLSKIDNLVLVLCSKLSDWLPFLWRLWLRSGPDLRLWGRYISSSSLIFITFLWKMGLSLGALSLHYLSCFLRLSLSICCFVILNRVDENGRIVHRVIMGRNEFCLFQHKPWFQPFK